MKECACEQEVKNRQIRRQLVKQARSEKYWGFLFPIPTITAIIIAIIFNIFIWHALGLKKDPDRPFEDELINQF